MSDPESTTAIHVVDDDPSTLAYVARIFRAAGHAVKTYTSAASLLADLGPGSNGCIVAETRLADMTGFDLLEALDHVGCTLPTIFFTEHGTIPAAVRAIRQGAEDFLSKSVEAEELLTVVQRAMERDLRQRAERVRLAEVKLRMRSLTAREREVLEHVLQGQRNKEIARELDIHERTVKLHRTNIATKLRVRSVAVMSRLAEESGAFTGGRAEDQYRIAEPGIRAGAARAAARGSEERRVGKECRSRWSPYH